MLAMVSPAAPLLRPVGARAGGSRRAEPNAVTEHPVDAAQSARQVGGEAMTALQRRHATVAPRIGCAMPAVPRHLSAAPDIAIGGVAG